MPDALSTEAPVVAPDAMALASIALWAASTALALGWLGLRSRGVATPLPLAL